MQIGDHVNNSVRTAHIVSETIKWVSARVAATGIDRSFLFDCQNAVVHLFSYKTYASNARNNRIHVFMCKYNASVLDYFELTKEGRMTTFFFCVYYLFLPPRYSQLCEASSRVLVKMGSGGG